MTSEKYSVDISSRTSAETDLDIETASTITATASNNGLEMRSNGFKGQQPAFIRPRQPRRNCLLTYAFVGFLWIMSLVFTARMSLMFKEGPAYSYEKGFETDLEPLRPFIAIKKVKFTGGLKFDDNGTTYRAVDPNETQYVGEPSPALDRAWQALIRGQGVDLRDDEAESVKDSTYMKPGGWYLTGPDAFHQLHCLNVLRRSLRPDYYSSPNTEEVHIMHLDHCIDYIRQGVMCAGDLTTIPTEWSTKRDRVLQNTEVEHTCRDFTKLHEWTLARDAGAHALPSAHPQS